jgi:serine protease
MAKRDVLDEHDGSLRVAVKFSQRSAAAFAQERRAASVRVIARRLAIAAGVNALEIAPLFESVDPKDLAELVDRARRIDPEYEPADFLAWFQVAVPEDADPDALAASLQKLEDVETAYVLRPGPPPVVNAADDPRSTNQGYLDAAPNGIDARFAWGFTGGDGAGIGWVDLEQGWNLNHEDLAAAGITLISGVNNNYFFHGTSVLGEISMVDNALGGVGIAPTATARVISQQRTAASYNTADAIVAAVATMAFGDVLLLEAQEYDPVGGAYFWPVEIVQGNYDAIRLATALGIVVIEAACNGGYDLDAYVDAGGNGIFNRAAAGFRDSGAIVVGAGSSTAPHSRLSFSNFGSRVDCYGWGQNVDTATTNTAGTDNTAYTTGFNGTSSASPIVAGAAVVVQGLAQASLSYRFSPRELRQILTTGGTASANPASDEIGVMPDLQAIINNSVLNLAPDLYLRDYVGDSGNPTAGSVSMSPDIIVRRTAVANPTTSFGPGSGTENNAGLSENVGTSGDHFVYVRVQNRGGSAAAGAQVDVYWSPPTTLVSPNLWTLIGTAALASVPTGSVLVVSDALTWPHAAIPGPGHYCFVAVAGATGDPRPSPTSFTTFDNYVTYVRNNNDVAWRNFDVTPGPPSTDPPGFLLPFMIAGAFDAGRVFTFQIRAQLPEGGVVFLDVPAWLAEGFRGVRFESDRPDKQGFLTLRLNPNGLRELGGVFLPAKLVAESRARVEIPDKFGQQPWHVDIRQLLDGEELGRLTWEANRHEPPGVGPIESSGARTRLAKG